MGIYYVVTREDGKKYDIYTPRSKYQFYTHKEDTLEGAKRSVAQFKAMGVYARIYKKEELEHLRIIKGFTERLPA